MLWILQKYTFIKYSVKELSYLGKKKLCRKQNKFHGWNLYIALHTLPSFHDNVLPFVVVIPVSDDMEEESQHGLH